MDPLAIKIAIAVGAAMAAIPLSIFVGARLIEGRALRSRLGAIRPGVKPVLSEESWPDVGEPPTPDAVGMLVLYADELVFAPAGAPAIRIPRTAIVDTARVRSAASFGADDRSALGGLSASARPAEWSLQIDWTDDAGKRSAVWAVQDPVEWIRAIAR